VSSFYGHERVTISGPAYTTSEKFENGIFTPRTHQIFSVHSTAEKFENATIIVHFGFVFKEDSAKKIT